MEIDMSKKAMELALEALEEISILGGSYYRIWEKKCRPAIIVLREALIAQMEEINHRPEDAFKTYVHKRVLTEKAELDKKLIKLSTFFHTIQFADLSEAEQSRLRNQARCMDGYAAVLEERIAAYKVQSKPYGYSRFLVDDAGDWHYHSFAKTTDGWNESFCLPLYTTPK
jgi:hypothetical protein